MSIELTRFFSKNQDGSSDLDSWVNIMKVVAAYRNSGPFTLKKVMPDQTDETVTFTQDDAAISDDSTRILEAWFNGKSDDMQIFITSTSAKPVSVSSVEVVTDEEDRKGDI